VTRGESPDSSELRRVTTRAVRRLNVLEYVILGVAAALAMLAGLLAALVLGAALDLPFRPTWIVASLVLFIVPATVAYLRAQRLDRADAERRSASTKPDAAQRERDNDGR
jgi:predicted lysophospholipase L1 biosynthesis ABC-type transport system permease subunit